MPETTLISECLAYTGAGDRQWYRLLNQNSRRSLSHGLPVCRGGAWQTGWAEGVLHESREQGMEGAQRSS